MAFSELVIEGEAESIRALKAKLDLCDDLVDWLVTTHPDETAACVANARDPEVASEFVVAAIQRATGEPSSRSEPA